MMHRFSPSFRYAPDEPPAGGGSTPPADPPAPTTPPGQTVPLDRFNEVIAQARQAQQAADAANARLQEIEDAKKDEATREKEAREREKARADAAEAALAQTRRDYALRAAAVDAGAISPDAIVALANQRKVEIDVDKPDTITKAIDAMKGDKDNPGPDAALFGEKAGDPPAPTTRFGVPTTPPPGSTPPATSDDPKLALGRGLLTALNMRGGQAQQ